MTTNDVNTPIVDMPSLLAHIAQGWQPKYLFFWGHQPRHIGRIGQECLSQWYDASFIVDGIHYATAEHFMMAEKARLFADTQTCAQILAASHPDVAKKLGRVVQNFDEAVWQQHRFGIVVNGNQAKFTQNHRLQDFLLHTGERVLVEASPFDTIWGIGLAEADAHIAEPTSWHGLNLLGFALMQVRSWLWARN